jgi:transposase
MGMEIDPDEKLYFKQFDFDYQVKSTGTSIKVSDRLKLNLYFDAKRKIESRVELDIAKLQQLTELKELYESGGILEDTVIKNNFCYYKVICDETTRKIKSFELDERKVAKALKLSGYFSILTHKLDFDAMETYRTYHLRDEQEKCFQLMKDQLVSDRQRNWSEDGKTGRLFILFVSLILGSYVRHVWRSTDLRRLFSSSLELLDEMTSIRCIEHTNRAKVITPFVGKQVDICDAFGFLIPEGCAPKFASRQKPKRKRGRPPKKKAS